MTVRRPVIVLYDDDCGFCRWSADRTRRLDARGALGFAPIQGAVGADLLGAVPPGLRLASMHAVSPDGRVWSGGEAVRVILAELPGGVVTSTLASMFPELTDRVYRSLARNRERFGRMLGEAVRCSAALAPALTAPHNPPRQGEIAWANDRLNQRTPNRR